jgi:DNA-directed RNA polymerase subunit beta'
MIKIGSEISPWVKTKYSGKIIEKNPFKLKIHKGTPFFKTAATRLYKNSGNFIKQEELLGMINFEQIVTGDIVQGLPKIEEILEARKPQNAAYLNQNPGIIRKIKDFKSAQKPGYIIVYSNDYEPKRIAKNVSVSKYYDQKKIKIKGSIIAKKNDFIYVGQPLTEGSVNPHNLLITYFSYYKNFTDDYESAYLSFKNIQILLVQKVQQVYNSQGVSIADKHLEVIIKKITSKVKITKTGSSSLLPGEIIELKQIEYINIVLKNAFKPMALYYPILLGITKASLLSDSFISAASFQETTKILTAAAIEGKIDWLRGLKENVIIGRLIPVGTGFRKEVSKK